MNDINTNFDNVYYIDICDDTHMLQNSFFCKNVKKLIFNSANEIDYNSDNIIQVEFPKLKQLVLQYSQIQLFNAKIPNIEEIHFVQEYNLSCVIEANTIKYLKINDCIIQPLVNNLSINRLIKVYIKCCDSFMEIPKQLCYAEDMYFYDCLRVSKCIGDFPNVERLVFDECPNLLTICGTFPKLQQIFINDCTKLEKIHIEKNNIVQVFIYTKIGKSLDTNIPDQIFINQGIFNATN